jgi:hypothetical protein
MEEADMLPLFDTDATPPLPSGSGEQAGLTCRQCGADTFKTHWQRFRDGSRHVRMDCAGCGAFQRYLPRSSEGAAPGMVYRKGAEDLHREHTAPAPRGWQWIGYVRSSDGRWRAVALCDSLGGCWDALLTTWQQGDLLCVPVRP